MAEGNIAALVAPVKSSPGLHYSNPRFPLCIKLPDNLECGTKIYVHGVVKAEPDRFAINLKNAEVDGHNYFHFNPRFTEGCVVRNSRLDEAWGDEERDGDMPFAAGEVFLICYTPTVDGYEVEVNGAPFITYNHREGMSLCDVTHIHMWGDVTVYGVHIPVSSLPIPLVLRIPKNTFIGDMIHFKGHVPDGAERFHVNFQCGNREDADIMYHFNPRLDSNNLVCNNRCADTWGDEQSSGDLPVTPGEDVNVCLVADKEGFTPFINGNPMPTFAHRLDVCAACTVVIDGDISLERVTVDCPPARLPPQVPDIDVETFDDHVVQALHATVPVLMKLNDGFGPGKAIYISGKVNDDAQRLEINLLCSDSGSEIALHVNPRWDDGPDLVFNSLDEDTWGEEVRVPNQIPAGSDVKMHVLCQDDGYLIVVDGDVVANFPHRIDSGRVNHVSVLGDITVHRILAN